jgi:hypothetical protein
MWAGVRPGLQILWVSLCGTGRFDSDSLPPSLSTGERFQAMSRRKPKPFRATKEVKRRARLTLGAPPSVQRHETRKSKPPKHKKRELDLEPSEA